jgi:hypothetical protein
MNSQLSANWKRAQELAAERTKLDGDLTSLQEELRFLSAAVNKKIAAKELVVAELGRLQESTAKLVATGEWVLKAPSADTVVPLSGVATGGQTAIISKTLDNNSLWNFVKVNFLKAWNFLFNKPKKVNPSATPVSQPVSSTVAS